MESSHPHYRTIVRFCKALSNIPGFGHERADRLQQALFSPSAIEVRNSLHDVLLLHPLLDAGERLARFAKSVIALGIQSHDHEYQATLRRWLDEQKQSPRKEA